MLSGLLDMSIWGCIAVTLVMTHITIAGVTIYLHRHQAHHALDLHPIVSHFFRFWLWLTTGMETREWVTVHRKHHAKVETEDDPHSPMVYGIKKVMLEGAELYRIESKNPETLERYGHGVPDDWIEKNLYTPHSVLGVGIMLVTNILLFGPIGLTMWAVQMLWIPVFAAGVVNGAGHYWGYRNYETSDTSTNIVPWGLLIGGEELHNNHHSFASSARFSTRWWEFDAGWLYIRLMQAAGLARVKKMAPKPIMVPGKALVDIDTLSAVIANRLQVMSRYAKSVLHQVHDEEVSKLHDADVAMRNMLKRTRSLLAREESRLSEEARQRLAAALDHSHALQTVYHYKQQLQAIWQERTASQERLLQALQEWCREAEATGIRSLGDFARTLRTYSLQAAA